jgi:hypothetical protein
MKTIRHTTTLFYYDGTQVSEARDVIGGHYVAVAVESEAAQDRFTGKEFTSGPMKPTHAVRAPYRASTDAQAKIVGELEPLS